MNLPAARGGVRHPRFGARMVPIHDFGVRFGRELPCRPLLVAKAPFLGAGIYVQNAPEGLVTQRFASAKPARGHGLNGTASTIFKFRAFFAGRTCFHVFFEGLRDPVNCGGKIVRADLDKTPLLHSRFRSKKPIWVMVDDQIWFRPENRLTAVETKCSA